MAKKKGNFILVMFAFNHVGKNADIYKFGHLCFVEAASVCNTTGESCMLR